MSLINPSRFATRRSLAVGVWSLLLALVALVSSGVTVGLAVCVLVSVSMLSSLALLIVSQNQALGIFAAERLISVGVSLVISLTWAWILSLRSEPQFLSTFAAVAIIPVAAAWLFTIPREWMLIQNERTLFNPEVTKITTREIATATKAGQPSTISMESNIPADEVDEPDVEVEQCEWSLDPSSSPNVTQWLTRSLANDGEIIQGGVRVDFAEGQREATVHVSFCPPLARSPEVTAEDIDGADLEIRVAATFPFGSRLTVRRPNNSSERGAKLSAVAYRIGFVAIAAPIRRAA